MYVCTLITAIRLIWLSCMATSSNAESHIGEKNSTVAESGDAETNKRQSRLKKRTEKGELYNIDRLKTVQSSKLSAVTRKRNEITQLMSDDGNLHLVKSALDFINDLFSRYQSAYYDYYDKLSLETDRDEAMACYELRERSFLEFRNQVKVWISLTEKELAEQLDHDSISQIGESKIQGIESRSNNHTRQSKSSRQVKNRNVAYPKQVHPLWH